MRTACARVTPFSGAAALILTLTLALAGASGTAAAQPSPAPAPAPSPAPSGAALDDADMPIFPVTNMWLPVESAYLRTKVDFGLLYTNATIFSLGRLSASANVVMLGVDAQVALAEKLELGILFPFLLNGTSNTSIGAGPSSTELGSLTLKLKGLLAGRNRGSFAVSLFSDITLPTGTNLPSREVALWRGGFAGQGRVARNVNVGGSLGWLWAINGNGQDFLGLMIDLFVGAKIVRQFGAQLGVEILAPLQPSGGDPALALTPALQFFPVPRLHIDLGVRIAANDAGRILSPLGRASLVFAAGVQY